MSRLTDEELAAVFSETYQAAYSESMATYPANAFHGIKVDGATGNALAAGIRAVADAAVAADRAGRGEPFAYCFTDVNGRAKEFCDPPEYAHPHDKRIITPLYTHALPDASKTVVPDKLKHTPAILTEYDTGYVEGWNACRDALLATQKEPTT